MVYKAFSIFDTKADAFNPPFFKSTNGQALRDFVDLANDPQTTVGRHPGDFKLVVIGEFDDSVGILVEKQPHESLGFASEYIKRKETP